jgi:hypothetical protein
MLRSKGEEMSEHDQSPICGNDENRYSVRDELLKIVNMDLNGLYLLWFRSSGGAHSSNRGVGQ